MEAQPHPRQRERLAALRSYEILDSEYEHDYDAIVALAARVCGTAISVINFIDEDRQWFKAETGLGVRETPLATSICSHAILETDFVEIPDTLSDPRMADNPLCGGEQGLRFYAGALLKTADGLPLGTLCVLDHQPRRLDDLQRDTMRLLARQVVKQLELRRALRREEVLRREMDHRVKNSLQIVSTIVRAEGRSAEGAAREIVDGVIRRIESMALLHEAIHHSSAVESVDLGAFMTRIGELLDDGTPGNVRVEAAVEAVGVRAADAASLAIIANEFAANSVKHAFPDGREGTIRLNARRLPGGLTEFVCADDGIGADIASMNGAGGLGLSIIQASASQLRASLESTTGEDGVRLALTFDPDRQSAAA